MTPIDLDRARAETPGVANVVHLNNAGAALMPAVVTERIVAQLRREAAIGGYEAEAEAAAAIAAVYDSIGTLIGAAPDEIAVCENATRAWDMAFYSFPFGPGDRHGKRANQQAGALAMAAHAQFEPYSAQAGARREHEDDVRSYGQGEGDCRESLSHDSLAIPDRGRGQDHQGLRHVDDAQGAETEGEGRKEQESVEAATGPQAVPVENASGLDRYYLVVDQ
jgi:hypothetical protein